MVKIRLPDGSIKEHPRGVTAAEVVAAIGPGLARKTVAARVNGEVIDLDISPAGDRIYAALGDLQNQVRAWSTASDRIVWSHVVAGDTQAVRFWGGNVYFGFHDGDRNDPSVRMLAADAATGVRAGTDIDDPAHVPRPADHARRLRDGGGSWDG